MEMEIERLKNRNEEVIYVLNILSSLNFALWDYGWNCFVHCYHNTLLLLRLFSLLLFLIVSVLSLRNIFLQLRWLRLDPLMPRHP